MSRAGLLSRRVVSGSFVCQSHGPIPTGHFSLPCELKLKKKIKKNVIVIPRCCHDLPKAEL